MEARSRSPGNVLSARSTGPVRPGERARRLRPRLHRPHQGPQEPRDRHAGPADPREPDASRRDRRRPAAGRRRRHPDPAARRVPAPRLRQARHHAARDRPVRRRHGVPAAGAGVADGVRAGNRARDRAPKARCCSAGATCRRTTAGLSMRTKEVEPVIRQVFVARGSRDMDQDALERKLYIIRKSAGHAIQALHAAPWQGVLRAVDVDAHDRLQGHAARASGRRVLPRPARRDDGVGARDGAPALLDQHVPDVGPRASVPLRLPQRRDQHAARQRQLDSRARRRDRQRRCSATTCTSSGR